MVEMSQSVSGLPMNMIDKDPALQWKWHEAYRDMNKNMYRTSYTDATHFRETYVRSDFPAGYGGHIPSIRHDILHRNTEFDRKQACMRQDPSRDSMVSFNDQISGVPTVTKYPCGAKKNPTKNVSLHDGTTRPLAPWGITVNASREMPNQRSIPATLLRARSTPMLQQAGSRMAGGGDSSGSSPARLQQQKQQQQQQQQWQQQEDYGYQQDQQGFERPPSSGRGPQQRGPGGPSPTNDGLRQSVDFANAEAMRGRVPTEAEVLREQMQFDQ